MFSKEWSYFYITIAIFFITILFIHFLEKRTSSTGFIKSNKFAFIIGVVGTFMGFTLSGFLSDLQQKDQDRDTAMALLEYKYETNTNEILALESKAEIIEKHLKIQEATNPEAFLGIDNNSVDMFNDNGNYFNIFSDQFRKNYPRFAAAVGVQTNLLDTSKDKDRLFYLKGLIVLKYKLSELLLAEKDYIDGKTSKAEYDKYIKKLRASTLENVKKSKKKPVEDLIPSDYLKPF